MVVCMLHKHTMHTCMHCDHASVCVEVFMPHEFGAVYALLLCGSFMLHWAACTSRKVRMGVEARSQITNH